MEKSINFKKDIYKIRLFGKIRVMIISALMVAMSIVLGKYLSISTPVFRLSFENLPIIITGYFFGPIIGMFVAIAADLIGCLLKGYAIIPLVTVGAAFVGLISGIISKILPPISINKIKINIKLLIAVFGAHLIGSVILKTIGLLAFYDKGYTLLAAERAVNYLIVGTLEYLLISLLIKNRTIRKYLESK